jgi:glyoxylase-like metal-dependent hydrolase (beta-lactamase superfamily II)
LGDELEAGGWRFEVHPTPGHAFDHVCLWQPERRWLVSGDLYVHPKVRYLRRIEKPWVHLASLERMRALRPRRLLCAHAGVVDDAEAALAAKGGWWRQLAADARQLSGEGLSPRRITRRLLGREGLFTYASFGDFSKINLIRALLESNPQEEGRASAADG